MCTLVCQTASWIFSLVCLCIQWFSGHQCVLFELLWHACAWQFLTCVMSCADTEMERKDKGLIGSYKVTVKLQESMLTAFGPDVMYLPRLKSTHCMSQWRPFFANIIQIHEINGLTLRTKHSFAFIRDTLILKLPSHGRQFFNKTISEFWCNNVMGFTAHLLFI